VLSSISESGHTASVSGDNDGLQYVGAQYDEEPIPSNHFDDDDSFGYMGDKPQVTLTLAGKVVASHVPLVRANMVLRNARKQTDVSFAVGDIVTVFIPKEHQSSDDFSRFYCRVISNPHGMYYELKCENGTLQRLFPGGELQSVTPEIAAQYQLLVPLDGPH
jgi:hypothetical protein